MNRTDPYEDRCDRRRCHGNRTLRLLDSLPINWIQWPTQNFITDGVQHGPNSRAVMPEEPEASSGSWGGAVVQASSRSPQQAMAGPDSRWQQRSTRWRVERCCQTRSFWSYATVHSDLATTTTNSVSCCILEAFCTDNGWGFWPRLTPFRYATDWISRSLCTYTVIQCTAGIAWSLLIRQPYE